MSAASTDARPQDGGGGNDPDSSSPTKRWPFWAFLLLLFVDALGSVLLMLPILPWISRYGGESKRYTFGSSMWDLLILAGVRILLALLAFLISYCRGEIWQQYPFDLYHPNGVKKKREELEEESLEQNFFSWLKRYMSRPAFSVELTGLITTIFCFVKALIRMNLELGRYADAVPIHPMFWLAMVFTGIIAVLEAIFADAVCQLLGKWGHAEEQDGNISFIRRIGSNLSLPLLANDSLEEQQQPADEEQPATETTNEDAPAVSDIGGDSTYKAKFSDLVQICVQDVHLLCMAFVFLLLAAAAQIYIPKFTGKILDILAENFANGDENKHESISDIPGFMSNVRKLVLAAVLGGVFSAGRGSIFTVVGARVNARLRMRLMDSLLVQDVGFFDVTKIGDITSRLSSDTTLVGDQVTLNVNVFLRSFVQAIGVLIFMFLVSWQLSILAFISVPAITVLSKWYGNFIRNLTKVMQKKLADGNSVSEASLSAMSTVHAFDANSTEFSEFEKCLEKYLNLNMKSAVAYTGYVTCVTSLPDLVTALVVFYGGLMVRNGTLTSGQLVSFLLYLQSLSGAFSNMGYIFSSLTQAVGAADKVFELMYRKPKIKTSTISPNGTATAADASSLSRSLGVRVTKTAERRTVGIEPETCRGEVVLKDVDMFYPARPQRQILHGMSLTVPPGKIAALVGQSGGGKSSVISLVQHLYEQSAGKVMIDGNEVHELSPRWLSQHISVVSQEPTLFGRSIKRNIIYGLEGTEQEPTQEEVERVAKLANADGFIEKLPMKYDTDVGERGVQLSGGQKQRIAIARALVRKPKVLLLDEATSALDAESEHMVQEAIDHMLAAGRDQGSEGMTVIIVAHRLSTIKNADIIFVVKDGKVVEQGSHSELLQITDGAYNALISRQMNVQKKLDEGGGDEENDTTTKS